MHVLVSKSGLSMRSSSSRFWPRVLRLRMLAVRLHRRISGSPDIDMLLKASSVYRRKHTPLPSRPARPARCIADDLVMSLVNRISKPGGIRMHIWHKIKICAPPPDVRARYCFSLHLPVSMTYLIPGMVIDVSAILVARIHFRVFGGVGLNALLF